MIRHHARQCCRGLKIRGVGFEDQMVRLSDIRDQGLHPIRRIRVHHARRELRSGLDHEGQDPLPGFRQPPVFKGAPTSRHGFPDLFRIRHRNCFFSHVAAAGRRDVRTNDVIGWRKTCLAGGSLRHPAQIRRPAADQFKGQTAVRLPGLVATGRGGIQMHLPVAGPHTGRCQCRCLLQRMVGGRMAPGMRADMIPPDNDSVGWQTDLHRDLKHLALKTMGGEPRITAGQIHLTGSGFNERPRAIAKRLLQNRPNRVGIRRAGGIHTERLALLLTLNHRLQRRGG